MRQRIYSTKNDNNRFKIARVRVGLTQSEVGKILNIVPSTISKWEAGVAIPDQAILTKVADLYQTSVDELLGRSVRAPLPYPSEPIINMPIVGSVRAGMDGNIVSDDTGDTRRIAAAALHGRPDEYFLLRVRGDSMYPEVLDGDCVLVRKMDSVESGSMAVVLYDEDYATVKWVEYVEGEDWVRLVPNNPAYPPVRVEGAELEKCRILGEVVDIMRTPRKRL